MKNTCIPFGFCKLALRRQNEKPGALMQKENEKLSHVENKRPSSSNGGGYSDRGSKRKTKKKKKSQEEKKKVRRSFGTKPIQFHLKISL